MNGTWSTISFYLVILILILAVIGVGVQAVTGKKPKRVSSKPRVKLRIIQGGKKFKMKDLK